MKQLRVKVESVEIDVKMLVTGAVELLNEVSSSKVTGEEERYSHTDLYDFAANVEGASAIVELPQINKVISLQQFVRGAKGRRLQRVGGFFVFATKKFGEQRDNL